jgi:hypothetical protein
VTTNKGTTPNSQKQGNEGKRFSEVADGERMGEGRGFDVIPLNRGLARARKRKRFNFSLFHHLKTEFYQKPTRIHYN